MEHPSQPQPTIHEQGYDDPAVRGPRTALVDRQATHARR